MTSHRSRRPTRRSVALGAVAVAVAPAVRAQSPPAAAAPSPPSPPAPAPPPEVIQSQTDAADRLTVKVTINGQGPFAFVVDTGAERSAIAADLAAQLMLPPGPPLVVHGVAGQVTVGSAVAAELGVGARGLRGVVLPLLQRSDVGAAGVLGIDAVQSQRVELDFLHREIRVSASTGRRPAPDEVVVAAKSRFGQLVLVDSSYNGYPILVVVDTGAERSIGNMALKRVVRAEAMIADKAQIYSVTGQTTVGQWALINDVKVGGFAVNHLPVVFADLHAFARWKLTDQPALLLGMDVLRQFDRVEIDFARRQVRFQGGGAANDTRWAGQPWRMG